MDVTASDEPKPKVGANSDVNGTLLAPAVLVIQKLGPSFYAAAVGALYVSGFLVLNSHLARFGVADIEFVDARYFLAGSSFLFFLVCFYIFAGRAVLFTPKWLAEDLKRTNEGGPRPFWSFVVFLHSFITGTFFCCLSSALFTVLAIGASESTPFYGVLFVAFFIHYTLDVTNLDLKFPRAVEAISIVTKLMALAAFFVGLAPGSAMFTVFLSYGAFIFFINLVIDTLTRYRVTIDRLTVSGINVVVFVLSSSIAFGALLYGQVSPKLGGARPPTVSVGLTDDARRALPPALAATNSQVMEGKLIHQTEFYTYIVSSDHTVRFRTTDIVVVVSRSEPKTDLESQQRQSAPPNRVRAGITPALPTPPSMRVRTRRLKQGNENLPTVL